MTHTGAPDLLDTIVCATRKIVETRRRLEPLTELETRAAARAPRGSAFRDALQRPDRINVIAECKRRSPSRGVLRKNYDPVALATGYERAGAAAISVLTEPTFFDGSLDHLAAVRAAVSVPILRKDFTIDEYQLLEASAAGADAVLLIAAALDDESLVTLQVRARAMGLAAVVEVHDTHELHRALDAGAGIVGVNNRNLRTLEVDTRASEAIAERLPDGVIAVSESGLKTPADLDRLRTLGYDAFLIGEWLMMAADPGAALQEIVRTSNSAA